MENKSENSGFEQHYRPNVVVYIYTIYTTKAEYTFFSSAHETFYRGDHMLGHKIILSKFKKTENIASIFSDHNGIKVEIRNKKKPENSHTHGY